MAFILLAFVCLDFLIVNLVDQPAPIGRAYEYWRGRTQQLSDREHRELLAETNNCNSQIAVLGSCTINARSSRCSVSYGAKDKSSPSFNFRRLAFGFSSKRTARRGHSLDHLELCVHTQESPVSRSWQVSAS